MGMGRLKIVMATVGFFRYPSHSVLNGTRFKFNKRVWNEYEIFFKPEAGSGIVSSRPAPSRPVPFTYKFNFKIKFNLNFKINLI